jgi:hypothetical protein
LQCGVADVCVYDAFDIDSIETCFAGSENCPCRPSGVSII